MSIPQTIAILLAAGLPLLPDELAAQTPACTAARSPAARTICALPVLSDLDRQARDAYAAALRRVSPAAADRIRSDQADWLAERDTCGTSGECLANLTRYRIGQLGDEGADPEAAATGFTGIYCSPDGADYLAVEDRGDRARIAAGTWTFDGYACSTPDLLASRKGDGYAVTDGECTLRLFFRGSTVVLSARPTDACHDRYCGHRAYLTELAFPVSARRPLNGPFDKTDLDTSCE